MGYSYNNVIKIIRNIEEEILFNTEAHSYWYMIAYKDGKLTISEVNHYYDDGDEWGVIDTKTNVSLIKEFECSLEEYTNFVIRFFNNKILYREQEYPQENYILNKIDVMVVE